MRNYCTLFDKNYLAKALALYESLERQSREPFQLFMLFMDEEAETAMERLHLPHALGISRRLMERAQQLSQAKLDRTWQEYCWTCASQLLEFIMGHFDLPDMTYLDADLFFFSDPSAIFTEIGERSIGIIPHRLIPSKQHLEVNGKFNVGMVHFKFTELGRKCLWTWAEQVRQRCDASTCGDQKYLDEWPAKYGDAVCILEDIGANVAPWNVGNYKVTEGSLGGPLVDGLPIIFYHFHEYVHGERLTNYELRPEDQECIYRPYVKAVQAAVERIENLK